MQIFFRGKDGILGVFCFSTTLLLCISNYTFLGFFVNEKYKSEVDMIFLYLVPALAYIRK